MGFSTLGPRETGELLGENDFFTDSSCLTRLGGGRAKKLLESFRGGRWHTELTGRFPKPGRVA